MAEVLTRSPHCRRVDDRQKLVDIINQDPIEKHFVAIVERGESDELLKVVALGA